MKNITKVGALLVLVVGLSLTVVGCSGGDEGMGKKKMGTAISSVLW